MPRKSSVPSYRLHKASGQARTIVNGRHVYLGKYGSPESRQQYARILAEAALPAGVPTAEVTSDTPRLLVSELLVAYLKFAEFRGMVDAVGPLNVLYGDTQADVFGPLKLKAVREHLVTQGLCRTETNKRIGRIKRVFKWAVSEELVSAGVHEALSTVTGLKFGRTSARESEPVKPVDDHTVELTLPYVTPQIAAMIRLQLLTGMRPGEVLRMRPCDIDMSSDVWIYAPTGHKGLAAGLSALATYSALAEPTVPVVALDRITTKGLLDARGVQELPTADEAELEVEVWSYKPGTLSEGPAVDRLSLSYRTVWNAFNKLVADFSADERDAMLRGTASRIYRLT